MCSSLCGVGLLNDSGCRSGTQRQQLEDVGGLTARDCGNCCDSSHTHIHHIINKIGALQSPPLKSLTSSLVPTLWGSISEPTRDYRAGSDTMLEILNDCIVLYFSSNKIYMSAFYIEDKMCSTVSVLYKQTRWA